MAASLTAALPQPGLRHRWPALALLALLLGAVGLLCRDAFSGMVAVWSRSDTFAHAFLVPPIALWLVWRQRLAVAAQPWRAQPLWLAAIAACACVWLLGEQAGVNAAVQFAAIGMAVGVVPLVLGGRASRPIAFPLGFLFFCVPFGEFLVEPMMAGTADFTIQALRFTGVPVYREGLQFVIPSGHWSVVEACSGVRYLIASIVVGTLFAHLNFQSTRRQLLFVLAAALVPVLANWVRAYMIVMLGHLSGNRLAVGVDHLIYGWVFFGVVIALMFMIGVRFADAPLAPPVPAAGGSAPGVATALPAGGLIRMGGAAVSALAVFAVAGLAHWQLQPDSSSASAPAAIQLPRDLAGGWRAVGAELAAWEPRFQGPSAVDKVVYESAQGRVGAWVGLYRDQGRERKLVTSTNVLIEQRSAAWLAVDLPPYRLQLRGRQVAFKAALLRTPADLKLDPHQRLLVLHAYRIGGELVTNDLEATLRIALGKLLGRGDAGAAMIMYVPVDGAATDSELLRRFIDDHFERLAAAVDAASQP